MNEINGRDFGRLEGKVDLVLDQGAAAVERIDGLYERHAALERRVDKWEQRAMGALTVFGLIGAGVSFAVNWLWKWTSQA